MDAMQIVQLAGAIMILVPFAGSQLQRLSVETLTYQLLNLLGSAILTATAISGQQWGFVLLEGVWAIMSAVGVLRVMRPRG